MNGTLKAGTTPVSGRSIVIKRVDPSGTWTQIGTATTATNGTYTFTRSDPQGTYTYYATFAGDTTYTPSSASARFSV
jgi:hypothetical protein